MKVKRLKTSALLTLLYIMKNEISEFQSNFASNLFHRENKNLRKKIKFSIGFTSLLLTFCELMLLLLGDIIQKLLDWNSLEFVPSPEDISGKSSSMDGSLRRSVMCGSSSSALLEGAKAKGIMLPGGSVDSMKVQEVVEDLYLQEERAGVLVEGIILFGLSSKAESEDRESSDKSGLMSGGILHSRYSKGSVLTSTPCNGGNWPISWIRTSTNKYLHLFLTN